MPKIRNINTPRVEVVEKAPNVDITRSVEDLNVTTPDSIIPNGGMREITKNYFQGSFVTTKEGTFEIGASYMGGTPKITTITVKPIPAKLVGIEVTGEEGFVYKNELAEVLLTFDKPLTEGMAAPTFRTNPNLMVASAIVYDEDKRSGTFNVMGVAEGEGIIFAGLGGVSKQTTLPVKDSPAILTRVVATPDNVIEGEQVEIRAVHDKKPLIELVTIEADPTLQKVGEVVVEGNDVVAVYKATEAGTKTVSVESYKISKTADVVVQRDMPKITTFEVPATVLEGKEFTVTATFDKEKYLDVADFKLVFPDNSGVEVVEALAVVGKTIVGKFRGTKEADIVVTCTYLSKVFGEPKRLKIRGLARVREVTLDKDLIKINETIDGAVKFTKVFEDDQEAGTVEVNSYLELAKEFTLDSNKLGGTFKVKGIKPGLGKVTTTLAGDQTVKNLNVEDLPPMLESITLVKDTIRKGEVTHLSLTFNKPEKATAVLIEEPAFVTIDKANPVVADNVITYNVTGKDINEVGADITVQHTPKDMDPITKTALVKVTADAKVLTFEAAKTNPEIGEAVQINFTANKKLVEGQDQPVFTVPEGVETTVEFAFDENQTTGKLTVKCNKIGPFKVSTVYGGVTKEITLTPVLPNVFVNKIDVDYENLEIGRKATVVATLDKAPFNLDNMRVQVNEFLTYNDDMEIQGDTVQFTVTGKGAGAGVITFHARKNNTTKNVTVVAVPVLQSATAKLSKVLLNTPVNVELTFDKAPNKDFVVVTPNVDESTVTMGTVNVEGNKANFDITILKAAPINFDVVYGAVTKKIAIEGVAGPTIKTATANNATPVINKDAVTITVDFNDDGALDATLLHVTLPAGVTQKVAPAVSGRTITAQYNVTTEGAKTVKVEYLGATKDVTFTGTAGK